MISLKNKEYNFFKYFRKTLSIVFEIMCLISYFMHHSIQIKSELIEAYT